MQRYFFLEQDRALRDAVCAEDADLKFGARKIFLPEDRDVLNANPVFYLKGSGETFPDLYQSPFLMVSRKVEQVFSMYEQEMEFGSAVLIDTSAKRSVRYYLPLIPRKDVLWDKAERFPDGREKQVILDKSKIGHCHIFYLADSFTRRPVVSLAAAESLLRRNVTGIKFEEAEMI